jgi:anhydro-N-acetylmuramic acid kinase
MVLAIGLMSGTSIDGVDAVLARFPGERDRALDVLAHAHLAFSPAWRAELLALNTPGANELHRAALAGNALVALYADAAQAVRRQAGVERSAVRVIGAHGQTVRHRPREFDGVGYTWQLNAPALLAERTGIDVVADFRSRDVAAGGTGAPLVPAFHRALFAKPGETVVVLNLGGIANLTVLRADGVTIGFDCGPANALMDHWTHAHRGRTYDADGAWAASGRVHEPLLARLMQEPYFGLPPPKSTGRDLFRPEWLEAALRGCSPPPPVADVQATLAELTARTVVADVQRHGAGAKELVVCGGGASNGHLMRRVAALLPGVAVQPSDAHGLPHNQVEASAFAWLALACVEGRPGNLPAVTGADGPRVLGAIWRA